MKDIKFKKDVVINGETYFEGDNMNLNKVTKEDLKQIWSLNEKGFIEPITHKEFVEFSRNIKNPIDKYRKDEMDG